MCTCTHTYVYTYSKVYLVFRKYFRIYFCGSSENTVDFELKLQYFEILIYLLFFPAVMYEGIY